MQKVLTGLQQPGSAFHAKLDNGLETWIDAQAKRFRSEFEYFEGEAKGLSVGDGWTFISYDPLSNKVESGDVRGKHVASSKIDDPVTYWLAPFSRLANADDLFVEEQLEDSAIIALGSRKTIPVEELEDDMPPGTQWIVRIEIDRMSMLPVAYDEYSVTPSGERYAGPPRITYALTDFTPLTDLPADFFSPGLVEDALVTIEDRFLGSRNAGLSPYWLGERINNEYGTLATGQASINAFGPGAWVVVYDLQGEHAGSGEVSIFIGDHFVQGCTVPGVGGDSELGDHEGEIIEGKYGRMHLFYAPPACAGVKVEIPDPPNYHRLSMTIEDTRIAIETTKSNSAIDVNQNPFNNREAIIGLVDYLVPAPSPR